ISVVVPIFNEEEIVELFHAALTDSMKEEAWEVVYVNDGSTDSSLKLLTDMHAKDAHVVVVDLSRNWGHMGAISAGLQTAIGDAVVLMDGDFQDPPEVVPELVAAWRNGAQVVTAVRRSRQERRRILAKLFPIFYRLLGALSDFPIPLNAGIFGLLDRQAVDSINSLREGSRYLPGLRAWVGYKTGVVLYDRLHVLCPLPTPYSGLAAAELARSGGGISQPVRRLSEVAPALTRVLARLRGWVPWQH